MAYVTTEYKVNKEKRTVVCIITTYNDMPERLAKYGLGDEDYDEITDVRIYKGKAKCAPEDTWDETYGRRLAEYRAAESRKKDIDREIANYIKEMNRRIKLLWYHGRLKTPHYPELHEGE